ncbi:nucleotide kinase domain-containing protein [Leptospira santarosai]|uniref:nucleotide kinase domain-containing protein n=1 Tax=Leptospira santarosai TaxID=28183 RepID=UPI000773E354|nr:nucleotide kinase domain-containing protein [Leptospira santarosai]
MSNETENMIREIKISPRLNLKVSPIFDVYWKFAFERQEIYFKRVLGNSSPWTSDPILREFKFTNVYRAADRVSQFLIKNIIYKGSQKSEEIIFRILLFKLFNRIETWKELEHYLGPIEWKSYNFEKYSKAFDYMISEKRKIYSAAYIMPSPSFGYPKKHLNHLRLIEFILKDKFARKIESSPSFQKIVDILLGYRSIGYFLSYQLAIDINYSEVINFSEMDFVVPGPGAKDGIRKCFYDTATLSDSDIIKAMSEMAEEQFKRLGLKFKDLWGRPLQLIDCQNLFCEVDKYSRVYLPEIKGKTGRIKIKQRYSEKYELIEPWFPPKWNLRSANFRLKA